MQRLRPFKYGLVPDGERRRTMRRFAGSRPFVYDKARRCKKIAMRMAIGSSVTPPCASSSRRNERQTLRLKSSPVHPFQQTLKGQERASTNFC